MAVTICCGFKTHRPTGPMWKFGCRKEALLMKMLIADDDISIITMIETICDWESLGITEILRAYNGQVALRLIEEQRPEVVVCDISMPLLSGIEVLHQICEENITTEFILLTAHANFEYAREALRYGAVNYLTKPFSSEELTAAVRAAISRVQLRREGSKDQQRHRLNLALSELYHGSMGNQPEQVEKQLQLWQCGLSADSDYQLVYASVGLGVEERNGWDEDLFRYAFRHLALEVISGSLVLESALDGREDNRYVVRMFIPAAECSADELEKRCNDFLALCQKHLHCQPLCLVGKKFPLYQAEQVGREMDKALHRARFLHNATLLQEQWECLETEPAFSIDLKELHQCLERKSKVELLNQVGELVGHALNSGVGDRLFHQLHQDLLQVFYSYLAQNGLEAHSLFRTEELRDVSEEAERSPLDFMRFVGGFYDAAVQAVESMAPPSRLVEEVKQYITEHFRENIDRESIAAAIFITPNYLSRSFKSETGLSLREYINCLRIQEAKRLLSQTNKGVSEIAVEVGFENFSYFSTVFKKMCGMSPLSYRNSRKQK